MKTRSHIDKPEKPRLVALVGPTAVGKTEIAIRLAQRVDGEIVSADSRLFYRGMDIGTAKPSLEERQRIPHHLIDVAEPDETWSLAVFQREACRAIADIHKRGKLPLLVGGTGQYFRAIVEGWDLPPQPPDTRLRQAIETWAQTIGPLGLYEKLMRIDPEAAQRIEPGNARRTIRALEVIFHTGKRFSMQRKRATSPYGTTIFGLSLPRDELYARIDRRIESMFETGLVDEVKRLLERGYSPELPTLSAIGYRETIAYLQGKMTLEEAKTQMRRLTHVFVRRQANWFKEDDRSIQWLDARTDVVEAMERILALLHL